jgi:hypothetical protein
MLGVQARDDELRIGDRFAVTFQRTLRLPDDGKTYPLPPGLGRFPIHRVADYADRVPPAWREQGGYFIPMYQREAMWFGFDGASWKPNAVQIWIGGVNVVTGEAADEGLADDPQNYLVTPYQPWLDGINVGDGVVRQFVAVRLGEGYTVEGQLTGREEQGGLRIKVFEPKPGRFPDEPPVEDRPLGLGRPAAIGAMGFGAGGAMRQRIYADPYGVETWDPDNTGTAVVHIVTSTDYRALTGKRRPRTPISAKTYTEYGLPWFDLYDEDRRAVSGSERLRKVRSVDAIAADRGEPAAAEDASGLEIEPTQIKTLEPPG